VRRILRGSTGEAGSAFKVLLPLKAEPGLLPVLVLLAAAALRLVALADIPTGLYYDESANGVDALRVLAGAHPVFFTGDQGREPLGIYLQAIAVALIGPSPFALRLPSAFLGLVTVAATYATFRAFAGRAVGLFGAALLAVSFWHVSLSRLAFRTVGLPLFSTLGAFWIWKGIRSGRARFFALGGAFVGADLYTYIPARLAPLLIALWLVGCVAIPAWRKPTSAGRVVVGGLVAAIAIAIVSLPLAEYFYLHPADFAERLQNVAAPATGTTLASGGARALAALVDIGDPNPRQDLPGRPLLDLPVTLAGLLGLGVGLRRWRDGTSVFAFVWCAAMLLPAALTDEPAHALRLAGVLPFILLFPSIGLSWLASLPILTWRRGGTIAVALVLVGGGLATARDYFLVWPTRADTIDAFQSDLLHATSLVALAPAGATTFVTADAYEEAPIPLVFLPSVAARARAFSGQNVFVVPADSVGPAYYAMAASAHPPGGLANVIATSAIATSHDTAGRIDGSLFRVDPPFALRPPARPVEVAIGGLAKVTGVDLTPRLRPGQPTRVALHWTVQGQPAAGDWQFFAHLVERDNQRLLAEDYNEGFPPSQWRAGDRVVSWFTLPVPADAPATVADVSLGLFDRTSGRRLDLTAPSGEPAGDTLRVGPVRIDRSQLAPPPAHPLVAHLGSAITLIGFDLTERANGDLALALHWRADAPVDRDYTVFVHVLDPSGKVALGADSQPGGGSLPTSTWSVGETFVDEHVLTGAGPSLASGRIEVGMYLLSSGERLPVTDDLGRPSGDAVRLK
jgi:4-amino-4-deoxy-L-arabinose transferase-like glycosyltransferase